MRVGDIEVGQRVALTYSGGSTAASAKEGRLAIPGVVMAIGKYRRIASVCRPAYKAPRGGKVTPAWLESQGLADDGHTTTVVCRVLDIASTYPEYQERMKFFGHGWKGMLSMKAPGMPEGLDLDDPRLVWKVKVYTPVQVHMPWELFVKMRQEVGLVEAEQAAMGERQSAIRDQIKSQAFEIIGRAKPKSVTRPLLDVRDGTLTVTLTFSTDILSKMKTPFAALYSEYAEIERRLSCER